MIEGSTSGRLIIQYLLSTQPSLLDIEIYHQLSCSCKTLNPVPGFKVLVTVPEVEAVLYIFREIEV